MSEPIHEEPPYIEKREIPHMPDAEHNPESSHDIIRSQLLDTIFHGQANDFLRSIIKPQEIQRQSRYYWQDEETRQESANEKTEEDVANFGNMRSMSYLRQQATELLEQYNADPMRDQSTKQAWYARKVAEIYEAAGILVDKYLLYKDRDINVMDLDHPTEEILADIKRQMPDAFAVSREIESKYGSKDPAVYVHMGLYHKSEDGRLTDSDSVSLKFSDDGNIKEVSLDESYYQGSAASTEELARLYKEGKQLSPSQIQLLVDLQLISPPHDPMDQEHVMRVPPQKKTVVPIPIYILGYVIPDDLKEKLRGKWCLGNSKPSEGSVNADDIVLNVHVHDQNITIDSDAILKADTLTMDDIYRLIGIYIDVLKAFPRISRR